MCSKVLRRTRLLLVLMVVAATAGSVRAAISLPEGVDIWFSTSTPTIAFKNGFQYLGPGSVLSTNGSVIATNQQLLSKFKPTMNFIPWLNDKGLDALCVIGDAKSKTIVFSTNKSFYSEALHQTISDGDLITNKGQILATQHDLLAAFQPRYANRDYGLDAAYIRGTDSQGHTEIWFSTDTSFYSQKLGRTIYSGDIISNEGDIVVSCDDLMKKFAPQGGAESIGVDSFSAILDDKGNVSTYLFSTNKKFYSNSLKRWINSNDLLSSDGTIAMTQKELTKNFGLVVPICGSLELDAAAFNRPSTPTKPTPEPVTLSLLALGFLGFARRRPGRRTA